MKYEIIFVNTLRKSIYEEVVWKILCECDKDFVPTLSSRENTYQTTNLKDHIVKDTTKPYLYFKELKKQLFFLVVEKDKEEVIGFLSFKNNYYNEELTDYNPSNYVTTTCIKEEYRNKGIGKELYTAVEERIPEKYKAGYVTRRTWSTNSNQLHLFKEMGYKEVKRIANQRGEGVDTVYFAKKIIIKK